MVPLPDDAMATLPGHSASDSPSRPKTRGVH
jgi:hypothetical protein